MASDSRGSDITRGKQDSTTTMQYLTEQGIFDARNHSDFAVELTHPGSFNEEPLPYVSDDSNECLHQDTANLCKSPSQHNILAKQPTGGPSSAIEDSKHSIPRAEMTALVRCTGEWLTSACSVYMLRTSH
jgi:hypothetical protein